jgi:hypothetical protein
VQGGSSTSKPEEIQLLACAKKLAAGMPFVALTRVTVALLIVRVIRFAWPFVHGWLGLVSRYPIPYALQIMSKRIGRGQMVFRVRGCLANWMPNPQTVGSST